MRSSRRCGHARAHDFQDELGRTRRPPLRRLARGKIRVGQHTLWPVETGQAELVPEVFLVGRFPMNGTQSGIYFRTLIRSTVGDPGSGEDIANINTALLNDGDECYVTGTKSAYRLSKGSTLTPSSPTVIA